MSEQVVVGDRVVPVIMINGQLLTVREAIFMTVAFDALADEVCKLPLKKDQKYTDMMAALRSIRSRLEFKI